MRFLKSYLKYFLKVRIVHSARSFFLNIFPVVPNRNGWGERLLIVYLQAIGDSVMFTSVLKHYKSAFPEKRISLLIQENIGMKSILGSFVDEVLTINTRRFTVDPWYGSRRIIALKKIGFETVLHHDHGAGEILGKFIAISLGAKHVVGYEGFSLLFDKPFDINMERGIRYVAKHVNPRFTRIIPSMDKNNGIGSKPTHVINHYKAIYETFTGNRQTDYSTTLPVDKHVTERMRVCLAKESIALKTFAVVNLGSSTLWKNWPVERFAEASSIFRDNGVDIVLVGAQGEKYLGELFQKLYNGKCLNLIGETSIEDTIALVQDSLVALTNDTSAVHIAVALKKPSVCVVGAGLLGLTSLYGHSDIHMWVYKNLPCIGDNWRCLEGRSLNRPAPCIEAVQVAEVKETLRKLLRYSTTTNQLPREPFSISYIL